MKTDPRRLFSGNYLGFTMVELMVVIAIFAIITAIAVPNFKAQQPAWRLNGAARQVMSELMWARGKAVQENQNVTVQFLATSITTGYGDGQSRTRDVQTDYPGVTLAKPPGNPDPTFTATGTTANGATVIAVSNPSGCRNVTVSVTGSVRINLCEN